jgi:hypothetical protein
MEKIINLFEYGLLTQIYQVRRNHSIWRKIADHKAELEQSDSNTTRLFHFLQYSAQTNTVIELSKVFDRPSRKYETRCILQFFKEIENNSETLNASKKTKLIDYKFQKIPHSKDFVDLIKSNDEDCAQKFVKFYLEKYNSEYILNLINQVLLVRDKYVAHNELTYQSVSYNPDIIDELCNFAEEIYETFNGLFHGGIYVPDIGDQGAYFIKEALRKYNIIKN